METTGQGKLLRIFVGEADKIDHKPLYEVIVREARTAGLAGATVWRGLLSYGPTSHVRTTKILDLATDLPIIIEIADAAEKLEAFLPKLGVLFEESGAGGMVTIEEVTVIRYAGAKKERSKIS